MSISSLKWHVIAIFFTIMMPSLLSASAAHSMARHTNNSSQNSASINEDVKENEFQETLSFGARAAHFLYGLIESGLKAVHKQRWKGLTIFLALQNGVMGNGVERGISVTNIVQNLYMSFDDTGPQTLLPITITNVSSAHPCCIATILTLGVGKILSSQNGLYQNSTTDGWTAQGAPSALNLLLSRLIFTPTKSLSGNSRLAFYSTVQSYDRQTSATGEIFFYPITTTSQYPTQVETDSNGVPLYPTTIDTIIDISNSSGTFLTGQSSPTTKTELSRSTSPSASKDQSSLTSSAETMSLSNINPAVSSSANKPPYEIIGGVVGGGVVLAVIGIAAFKLKTRKKSSDDRSHNKESGAQNNYGKVEAPQNVSQYDAVSAPFNSGYVGLPASALKNQYENLTLAAPHSASSSPLNAAYEEPPVSTRNNQYTPAPQAATSQPFAPGPAILPVSARHDQYESLALTSPS